MVLPVVLVELLARIEMRSAALAVELVCVRHMRSTVEVSSQALRPAAAPHDGVVVSDLGCTARADGNDGSVSARDRKSWWAVVLTAGASMPNVLDPSPPTDALPA